MQPANHEACVSRIESFAISQCAYVKFATPVACRRRSSPKRLGYIGRMWEELSLVYEIHPSGTSPGSLRRWEFLLVTYCRKSETQLRLQIAVRTGLPL